jgi:phosphoketolase
MIFLTENVLLENELTHADIKARLLGHWGTCPGLSLVYAHLNRLIRNTDLDALYVVGPGQALASCIFDINPLKVSLQATVPPQSLRAFGWRILSRNSCRNTLVIDMDCRS